MIIFEVEFASISCGSFFLVKNNIKEICPFILPKPWFEKSSFIYQRDENGANFCGTSPIWVHPPFPCPFHTLPGNVCPCQSLISTTEIRSGFVESLINITGYTITFPFSDIISAAVLKGQCNKYRKSI